jgi:hypothetical protein
MLSLEVSSFYKTKEDFVLKRGKAQVLHQTKEDITLIFSFPQIFIDSVPARRKSWPLVFADAGAEQVADPGTVSKTRHHDRRRMRGKRMCTATVAQTALARHRRSLS